MSRLSVRSFTSIALALALGASPVGAAEPQAVGAETRETLRVATEHFVAGRYQQALDLMRSVEQQVADDGSVHWNMARCLEELGRPREAIAEFEKARELAQRPADVAAADQRIAALRETLPAVLEVKCTGWAGVVEGQRRPCPAHFELPAGVHRVSVLDQEIEHTVQVTLAAGENQMVSIGSRAERVEKGISRRTVGFILLGGAALAVGGGLLASSSASSAAEEARSANDRDTYDRLQGDYDLATALTWTAYAAGAGLVGVGLWLALDEGDGGQTAGLTWAARW